MKNIKAACFLILFMGASCTEKKDVLISDAANAASDTKSAISPEKMENLKSYFLKKLGGYSIKNICVLNASAPVMKHCQNTFSNLARVPNGIESVIDQHIQDAIETDLLDTKEKIDGYIADRKKITGTF
jgi:hypothetical protein